THDGSLGRRTPGGSRRTSSVVRPATAGKGASRVWFNLKLSTWTVAARNGRAIGPAPTSRTAASRRSPRPVATRNAPTGTRYRMVGAPPGRAAVGRSTEQLASTRRPAVRQGDGELFASRTREPNP